MSPTLYPRDREYSARQSLQGILAPRHNRCYHFGHRLHTGVSTPRTCLASTHCQARSHTFEGAGCRERSESALYLVFQRSLRAGTVTATKPDFKLGGSEGEPGLTQDATKAQPRPRAHSGRSSAIPEGSLKSRDLHCDEALLLPA
eukprot:1286995-Rhodomonas_salina.1